MLQFINVSKRYPGGADATEKREFWITKRWNGLSTGHSGAGKSTLLKLIAILERSTQGQVMLDNQNIGRISKRNVPYARRKIGMIFQDHRLLYDHTVFDNVSLPLIIAGLDRHDIKRRVRAALDKVGLLGKEQRYPITLSGGEQQRIGIARAVVNRPPIDPRRMNPPATLTPSYPKRLCICLNNLIKWALRTDCQSWRVVNSTHWISHIEIVSRGKMVDNHG